MQENWEALVQAIILQAVEDYRKCRRLVRRKPNQFEAQKMIREVERFLRSEWFKQLSAADGNMILELLKKEVA